MLKSVLRRIPRAATVAVAHKAASAAASARALHSAGAAATAARGAATRVAAAPQSAVCGTAWRHMATAASTTAAKATAPAASTAAPAAAASGSALGQTLPNEADDTSLQITRKFTHSTVSEPSIRTGGDYTLPHPIWNPQYLESVEVTHVKPQSTLDRVAYWTIQVMRKNFDIMSGYAFTRSPSAKMWLNRIIFLESVAGVPGSIGATVRHLASLRRMKRDHGWIHTLLEEAENERMHLLTAIELRKPGPAFRFAVLMTQGIFFNFFWVAYLASPRFCHRMVGYLEEEAVKTYTHCLQCIDRKEVWANTPAPAIARAYWRLPEGADMRAVIANIRADESHHRDVNHKFADLKGHQTNPFAPGH